MIVSNSLYMFMSMVKVYDWCDHYKMELKGAGTYLCKFFDPSITREEYNKLKENQK